MGWGKCMILIWDYGQWGEKGPSKLSTLPPTQFFFFWGGDSTDIIDQF